MYCCFKKIYIKTMYSRILDIFPLQVKSINHEYIFVLISNQDNENLTKNWSETKNLFLAQNNILVTTI